MRSLILPLLLALFGFGLLVFMTLPADLDEDAQAELIVTGHLSDGAAGPMLKQAFEGTLIEGQESYAFHGISADDGRFEVMGAAHVGVLFELLLWTRDERGSVNRFSRLQVDMATLTEDNIGDLAMGTLPTLAAGQVTDTEGAPVPGASLSIEALDATVTASDFPLDGFSDDAGNFRLYGLGSESALVLHASADGFESQVVETLGAELSIVMQRL